MTSKDFIAIADVLAGQWACNHTREAKLSIWATTLSLADMCARSNDRFDRDKFYAAVFGTSDHFDARASALISLPAAVQATQPTKPGYRESAYDRSRARYG